jgi:hypothetical protein
MMATVAFTQRNAAVRAAERGPGDGTPAVHGVLTP